MGAEYDSLIWFNRAADAEVWGYTMCEECSDYHDYDFHSDICDYYFETDDPLLITTMELSLECGYEAGCESGRESMHEEVNWAYEDGYEDGRDRGRLEGREEAESEYEYRREEIRENRSGVNFRIGIALGLYFHNGHLLGNIAEDHISHNTLQFLIQHFIHVVFSLSIRTCTVPVRSS